LRAPPEAPQPTRTPAATSIASTAEHRLQRRTRLDETWDIERIIVDPPAGRRTPTD
jgi:hypothetical protein